MCGCVGRWVDGWVCGCTHEGALSPSSHSPNVTCVLSDRTSTAAAKGAREEDVGVGGWVDRDRMA